MPFSRENIKFTVLTIGFVLLCIVGVAGVVAIARSPTISSTPLTTAVIAFVSIQAGQLLIMLRTEQAHAKIGELQPIVPAVKHAEQVATNVEQKVEAVQEKLEQPRLGRDELRAVVREELRPMVKQIVEEVCERLNKPPSAS